MPRIARVELRNFKTFGPGKVELEFDGGLTVITGPNGSGKSNIVDAIAFALGELSPCRLRVRSLSGLIRKGASKAVVKLVLDNSDGGLPVPSKTVSLSRELGPGGESCYRLNGRRISRSELLRLLSTAGISPSGPNIVMQGRVMEMASMGPWELRELVEERLGIKSYEEERAEAEERLRRAEVAIREARARAAEISSRLGELEAEVNDLKRKELIRRELEALRACGLLFELRELSKRALEVREAISSLEERLIKLTEEERALRERLSSRDVEAIELTSKRLSGLKFELGKAEALLMDRKSRLEAIRRRMRELEEELSKAEERVETLRGRLRELSDEKKRLEKAIWEARKEGGRLSRGEARKAVLKCFSLVSGALRLLEGPSPAGPVSPEALGKIRNMLRRTRDILKNLIAYFERPRHGRGKLDELNRRIGALEMEEKLRLEELRALEKNAIPSLTARLDELGREEEAVLGEISSLEEEVSSIREAVASLEAEERALSRERASLIEARERLDAVLSELSELREARVRLEAELSSLLKRSRSLALELKALCRGQHVRSFLREPLERDLARWAREKLEEELEALGPVNQLAEEHYERELKRYIELAGKLGKLEEEKAAIIDFMAHIEERKREELTRALDALSERLSSVFSRLTGGGRAWLSLQDPSDPFGSGVELIVEFPGKGPISLRGASGGERSVASLALLLALQSLTPSPFYVLDEVDAHLDQEHVCRLAELLKELAQEAQFIVITLRPDVAAVAERVYGLYYSGGTRVVRLERGAAGWRAS